MFPANTKILVVDDSSTMRGFVRKSLKELGLQDVHEADDGTTALTSLKEAQAAGFDFDLIISDNSMPKMKGTDLLKACKEDPNLKDVIFIMATVESERHQIAHALRSGAADYIVKPYLLSNLKEVLERVSTSAK